MCVAVPSELEMTVPSPKFQDNSKGDLLPVGYRVITLALNSIEKPIGTLSSKISGGYVTENPTRVSTE